MLEALASDSQLEPDWPEPDMSILRPERPRAPRLPIEAFGPAWSEWIRDAAEAAACPPDYVAAPLLAAASALIGNARWAQATPGWAEPPHLWLGVVGESGSGKSPGADCLMRDVLPEIEWRMRADFSAHRPRNPCRGSGANPPRLAVAARANPAVRSTS